MGDLHAVSTRSKTLRLLLLVGAAFAITSCYGGGSNKEKLLALEEQLAEREAELEQLKEGGLDGEGDEGHEVKRDASDEAKDERYIRFLEHEISEISAEIAKRRKRTWGIRDCILWAFLAALVVLILLIVISQGGVAAELGLVGACWCCCGCVS